MSRYAKTVVAVLIAALTVLASAITDDVITNAEKVNIILAALGAVGVYAIPNTPPKGEPARDDMSEQGAIGVGEAVVIGILVLLVLVVVGVV